MILSGRKYKCSAGEQIDLIAAILYGSEKYAADLLEANPKHALTQVFDGGEELEIPYVLIQNNNPGSVTMSDIAPWKE